MNTYESTQNTEERRGNKRRKHSNITHSSLALA